MPLRSPAGTCRTVSRTGGASVVGRASLRDKGESPGGCLRHLPLPTAEGVLAFREGERVTLPDASLSQNSEAASGNDPLLVLLRTERPTRVALAPVPTEGRAALRGDGIPPDLVLPPVIHLHGAGFGVTLGAERSAGFSQWVDNVDDFTHRNLVARLLLNRHEVARRLIRLGSLSSLQRRADPTRQTAHLLSASPSDERSPLQRRKDAKAYGEIVAFGNICSHFGLTLPHTRVEALQALHLAEDGHHALRGTAASAIENIWRTQTLAATNKGTKTTQSTYRGCVLAFCTWAAVEFGDDEAVMPLSRDLVVTTLEAEKVRRVRNMKRRRADSEGRATPVARVEAIVALGLYERVD